MGFEEKLPAGLFCKFKDEDSHTSLVPGQMLNELTCLVPKTSTQGKKVLQIVNPYSSIDVAELTLVFFDFSIPVKTTPRILEAHRTDQTLEIDFSQTFQDLSLRALINSDFHQATLSEHVYFLQIPSLPEGPVTIQFFLSEDSELTADNGLSIALQVVSPVQFEGPSIHFLY